MVALELSSSSELSGRIALMLERTAALRGGIVHRGPRSKVNAGLARNGAKTFAAGPVPASNRNPRCDFLTQVMPVQASAPRTLADS
jgi:hypothetical protein